MQLIHVAFPVSTYSSVVTLAIVFLVTDILRYRSVVIFEATIYVMTWVLLIIGDNLESIIVCKLANCCKISKRPQMKIVTFLDIVVGGDILWDSLLHGGCLLHLHLLKGG